MKKVLMCLRGFFLTALMVLLTTGLSLGEQFNWRQFEGTTLRVLRGKSAFTPIMKKATKEFEALTGIKVRAEYIPASPLRKKLIMELGGKNTDLDLFGGMVKTAYQYDKAGWLEPLDKYLANPKLTHPDFDQEDIFSRTHPIINGRMVGFGTSCNPLLLMYRKDLFKKYNIKVPTNWTELENAAKVLKKNLPKGQFAWIARMNHANTGPFAAFMYTNNGSWLDENGKPAFNRPPTIEAMKFYGKMAREYGPPGASTFGWKEVIGAVAQGKAAMTVDISIFATLMLEHPKRSRVVGKMGYALVPPGIPGNYVSILPVNTTHVSALSKKKEAAYLFAQYTVMKKNFLRYKMAGLPVVRKSSWEHPKWKARDKTPELSKLQVEAMENGMIGFEIQISRFTEARPILSRVIYTAYEGGDVQKAADAAVKDIERLLE